MSTRALLAGVAVLFLATGTAHATADGCAVVKRTPDGFLNMRSAPMMGAKIIAKLKPGNRLNIDSATCVSKGTSTICNTDWVRVLGFHGIKFGWVHIRFLNFVDCDDATAGNKAGATAQAVEPCGPQYSRPCTDEDARAAAAAALGAPALEDCDNYDNQGRKKCITRYDGPDAQGRHYICPGAMDSVHIANVHALSDTNRYIISVDFLRKRYREGVRMPIIRFDTETQTLTVNGKRCRLHCTPDMECE
jgi:hypothetical protein